MLKKKRLVSRMLSVFMALMVFAAVTAANPSIVAAEQPVCVQPFDDFEDPPKEPIEPTIN
jgi:hypothetical protein